MALLHQCNCDQILIAEALSDLGSVERGSVRGLEITAEDVLQQSGDQQIATLDTVTLLAFEQSLRASEPSQGGTHLAAEKQVVADPEGAAHGARGVASLQVCVMGALQAAHVLVVAAEHVGRPRQEL